MDIIAVYSNTGIPLYLFGYQKYCDNCLSFVMFFFSIIDDFLLSFNGSRERELRGGTNEWQLKETKKLCALTPTTPTPTRLWVNFSLYM